MVQYWECFFDLPQSLKQRMVYAHAMVDDDFIQGDLISTIYCALDRLEELDPESVKEPWFQLVEKSVGQILAPRLEAAYLESKKLH